MISGPLIDVVERRAGAAADRQDRSCGAGASVRSAARSLAERARGLAATSSSSAMTGLLREHAEGRLRPARFRLHGASRATTRPRSARKVLTMRSSSEWNEIDDEPPARLQHALGRGKRRGEFAQFVVDEHAQRLERARRRMDLAGPRAHDARDDRRRVRAWS